VGTVRVRDIRPGNAGSTPTQLIDVSGTLYFVANDGVAGIELWTSDGTEQGTRLVSDLRPGGGDAKPVNLTNIDGQLYFHANDGSLGVELWRSDGSAAGTELIADFDAAAGVGLSSLEGRLVVVTLNDAFREQLWIEAASLTAFPGDYDASGAVDGADFLAWQRGFGGVATPAGSGADGDGSGVVDGADLAVWTGHFGEGNVSGVAMGVGAAETLTAAAAFVTDVSEPESSALVDEFASTAPLIAHRDFVPLAQTASGPATTLHKLVRSGRDLPPETAAETPPTRPLNRIDLDAAFASHGAAMGEFELRRAIQPDEADQDIDAWFVSHEEAFGLESPQIV
jgi:ELWxxDGT repeat protein